MKPRPAQIFTYKDAEGRWRWQQVRNGDVVADSGYSYGSRWKARRAARAAATSPVVLVDDSVKEVLR